MAKFSSAELDAKLLEIFSDKGFDFIKNINPRPGRKTFNDDAAHLFTEKAASSFSTEPGAYMLGMKPTMPNRLPTL